jgi:hypothetical protein
MQTIEELALDIWSIVAAHNCQDNTCDCPKGYHASELARIKTLLECFLKERNIEAK